MTTLPLISFWNECSTQKRPVKQYNEAQIEEEYGEKLLKLSQINLAEYEEPLSTFAESLHNIPSATEAAARAHIDLAQQISQLLQTPLAGFVKEQKQLRKMVSYLSEVPNL
ncbi:hypothetical protein DFQ30_005866 [Apophysomyces sp. BC1015]|nr:hypothetical protein DFQ30_005866 [Apophysomyces sp. BC1015]